MDTLNNNVSNTMAVIREVPTTDGNFQDLIFPKKTDGLVFASSTDQIPSVKSSAKNPLLEKQNLVNELLKSGRAIPANLLFGLEIKQLPMLVESIFPKVGLVGLVGSSDTGKSAFLRQLATSVCFGEKEFLGFPLNLQFGRALYITTEDDHIATSHLLRVQNPERAEHEFNNLKFLFSSKNVIEKLSDELFENPVDIVIVDAYSDVIRGDMNQANGVREFLEEFLELAIEFECLFIFLHHTRKDTQNSGLSKNNILGSTGFEGKMRLVAQLVADQQDKTLRHLCIIKGNYVKSEDKTHSFLLKFNDNMVFHNTDKRVEFKEILSGKPHGVTNDSVVIEHVKEYRKKGKSLREISSKLGEMDIPISKSTVQKITSQLDKIEKANSLVNEQDVVSKKEDNSYFERFMNI